jgi:thiamine-phosphate pyrophosphorylase
MAADPARLAEARLYFVTDGSTGEHELREALAGGVDILQLREKTGSDDDIRAAAAIFRAGCAEQGALFVVNDRPDLALAAGADAVHVGQDDEAVASVRERVGDELLIGLSTHSREQLAAALETDADYFCVGPVYATPTKPDYEPVGLDLVRYASGRATVPWFAIGGIDPGNVGDVVRAGAERVVVVRAIRDAGDPGAAARALRQGIDAALQAGVRR